VGVLSARVGEAATYYVATTGSDGNTCTQVQNPSTPKRTINAALNCLGTAAYAGAGHTVEVAAGTYTETINNNLPGGSSWSAPFTLAAAATGTVIIQPPVGAARCMLIAAAGSQYAVVSGLVCDGVNISAEGIKITDSTFGAASFIRLQDVEIKNAKHHGLLVVRSTDNEFIRLTVHDNGTTDDSDHGIYISEAAHGTRIEDSTVYNNHASGILVSNTTIPPDGCLVRNNRAYANGTSGLVLSATNTLASNNVIYNNHTAAGNLLGSTKVGLKVGGISTGVKLYNNTVYGQQANTGDRGILVASGVANTEVRNNIAYNNAQNLSDSGTNTLLTNNLTTDPQFVNAANADFHLQSTSPGIDAGATLPDVPTDYDGNPRPQGLACDIGAYEFGSGAVAFDFSLSNGGNQAVTRGASASNPISATLVSGTAQAVAFTASGLPPEVIASFAPASCPPPCAPTLAISTSASTPIGTYPIIVTGTGGSGAKTTSFQLTVNAPAPPSPPPPGETPANFTVAFIGDQGTNSNSGAVLLLIKNKGAQLVIHSGDLAYDNEPTAFDNMVTNILGSEFPYLVSRGNHDIAAWGGPTGYQALLQARLDRYNNDPVTPSSDRIICTGSDLGLKSSCTYRGLRVLLIDPTAFADEDLYIQQELANSTAIWNVCSWLYQENAIQVGVKSDAVGWADYEECRKGGAIIATAHAHSYARTRTLANIQTQTVDAAWPDANTLRVVPGSTFVFGAGLGGKSIESQDRCLPTTFPYGCNGEWAKIYASDQSAQFGVLFITFNVDGDAKKAQGEFFNITDPPTLIDSFTLTADPSASSPICGDGLMTGSEQCDLGAHNGQAGFCCSATCQLNSAATVCRAAVGACDVAETCTGTSPYCPANTYKASTTVCRSVAGACDVAETCTGTSAYCPADTYKASATVCRPAIGACDVAEVCTGTSAYCPANTYKDSSTVCRSVAGICDVAESCTGSSAYCPANTFKARSTVCRPAAGACDVAETCTGSSAYCPVNTFKIRSTVCRPATGACDVAASCTGTSPYCPANTFKASGTVCRPAVDACDVAESCAGTSAYCPANGFQPDGTTCDDGDPATCNDQCTAGSCAGSTSSC